MNIIIFAIIVLIVLALFMYALDQIPGVPQPFNWILRVLFVILAILLICNRAGIV